MREIFKDLEASLVDLKKVLEDVRSKKLTGYLVESSLSFEKYMTFYEGKVIGKFKYTDGEREELKDFKLENSLVSLYEVEEETVLNLTFSSESIPLNKVFFFLGSGRGYLKPTPLSTLNLKGLIEKLREEGISGYLVIYNPTGASVLGVLEGGSFKAFYSREGKILRGDEVVLALSPKKSLIGIYSLPPEVSPFLYSLEAIRKVSLNSFKDLKTLREHLKEISFTGIILLTEGYKKEVDLFYQGELVETLFKERGIYSENKLKSFDNYQAYLINLLEKSPTELSVNEDELLELEKEITESIKVSFVEVMGPLGNILFEKKLREVTFNNGELLKVHLKPFLELLSKEIPEEAKVEEFYDKLRRRGVRW